MGAMPTTDDVTARPLLIETTGRVRTLTINRPDRQNALNPQLLAELTDAFLDANSDPEVWVVVLTAAGDRTFCAGMDLKDTRASDSTSGKPFRGPMDQPNRLLFEVIAETTTPTICAINGAAVGGGCEMALACDIRIAASGVRFGLPEAKIGMGAIYGSVVLPRMIPVGIALEMMFTGDYMAAEDALRWGLINHLVPHNELLSTAHALAQRIGEPITVRRMKQMAMKGLSLPVATALRLDVGPNPYTAEDREEGIRAYLEKRKPQWKGR
jgi:enoyl-CoA hydratase